MARVAAVISPRRFLPERGIVVRRALAPSLPVRSVRHFRLLDAAPAVRAISRLLAIAEMTGTTLHTVSRLLSAWEDQGIVRSGRQKVTVTDPHALMLVSENRRKGPAA